MSSIAKEEQVDTAVNVQPAVETSTQTNGTNGEPSTAAAPAEEVKAAPQVAPKSVEKPYPPVPLLVLPAKAVANHLAQNELAKAAHANAASSNSTRPTVPPLVFPLANIFEERTPLPLSGHNGGLMFGGLDSASHPPGSAASSNPQWDPSDPNVGTVQCTMFHKIRGGKGEWKEIVPWEMIRVTKGVGKKVKMVVEAPGKFGPSDIQLSLQDMTESGRTPRTPAMRCKSSRFIVESTTVGAYDTETGKTSAELIIKLFKLSKQLVFHASVTVRVGPGEGISTGTQRGHTAPFGTHNSGKQRRKREKDGDEDDEEEIAHGSSAGSSGGGNNAHHAAAPTHNYNSRRKQAKLMEQDDDSWHELHGSHSGSAHSQSGHHQHQQQLHSQGGGSSTSSSTTVGGGSDDLLDTVWPSDDTPMAQQKEMITQINNMMRDFGNRYLLEEARKRGAGIVVYVACRRSANQPEDFTTFVYKQENLLREDAVTMGTPLGRALFIPADERGDVLGVYTLVAAVRNGLHEMAFAPNSGIAAIYDFRRAEEHLMKTIPIHPVFLAQEPTSVWLIGSFQVDPRSIMWIPSVAQQQQQQQQQGAAGAAATAAAPQQAGPYNTGRGRNGATAGNGGVGQQPMGSYGAPSGGPPTVPPLALGPATLGYPHLALQYSPRGTLHSPTPYYGAGAPTASGYLAPKPMYGNGSSPAQSPSSTPIPGGPPTPGLGQTPRGFGDMLSPFGGGQNAMMSSGFYSPLSNAGYSQQFYMLDPGLLLSARGLQDGALATPTSAAAGFYSPTSGGGGLNLGNFKNQGNSGYPYNFFPGGGGLQTGLPGYPTNSPRFEELLDSARM